MYRLFAQDRTLAYLLLPLLLVLLKLRLLVEPQNYIIADTPEYFTPLWDVVFGHVAPGGTLWVVLGYAVPSVCALMICNLVNRYDMAPRLSALGGLYFILLSGSLRPSVGFSPAMVFCVALTLALDRFMSAVRKENPSASVAWGFAHATLGSLLWAKGFWFMPFLLVLLFVLRIANARTLLAALLGVAGVVLLSLAVVLVGNAPLSIVDDYAASTFATLPLWRTGWRSWTYLTVCTLLAATAVVSAQRRMSHQTILSHRQNRMAVWLIFFCTFLMILPGFSYETQILAAVGAGLLLPQFFMSLRSQKAQEGITLAAAAAAVWILWC